MFSWLIGTKPLPIPIPTPIPIPIPLPLLECAYAGDLEGVKAALERGESTHKKNEAGRDVLNVAVASGYTTKAEFLLHLPNIDVNSCDKLGLTAMHHAV